MKDTNQLAAPPAGTLFHTQVLNIITSANCPNCNGTGFAIRNSYNNIGTCNNYLEVRLYVCSCVKVVAKPGGKRGKK